MFLQRSIQSIPKIITAAQISLPVLQGFVIEPFCGSHNTNISDPLDRQLLETKAKLNHLFCCCFVGWLVYFVVVCVYREIQLLSVRKVIKLFLQDRTTFFLSYIHNSYPSLMLKNILFFSGILSCKTICPRKLFLLFLTFLQEVSFLSGQQSKNSSITVYLVWASSSYSVS